MVSWFRAVWGWLKEGQHLWLTLFVVVISLAIVLLGPGNTELRIRVTGLALQLFGIATVAWGIRRTRQLFGRPSIVAVAAEWLSRFPRTTGHVATAEVHAILPGATMSAFGYARRGVVNPTLEDRVSAIESNLRGVNDRLDLTHRLLDQEVRDRKAALDTERQARTTAKMEIESKLEVSQTGGLHISAMGVVWLTLGITLSTVPNEISEFLK